MSSSIRRSFVVVTFIAGLLSANGVLTSAQWLNYPIPGVPRTKDGKVDLTAKAPRTADGHPNLSGVWHVYSEPLEEKKRLYGAEVAAFSVLGDQVTDISKYAINLLTDLPSGEVTLTSEGRRR